jgi:hypothetical protein
LRRAALGHQVGKFVDDPVAAAAISKYIRENKLEPGAHEIPIPDGVAGVGFLKDRTHLTNPDKVLIYIKKNGRSKTAYPFSSKHPSS